MPVSRGPSSNVKYILTLTPTRTLTRNARSPTRGWPLNVPVVVNLKLATSTYVNQVPGTTAVVRLSISLRAPHSNFRCKYIRSLSPRSVERGWSRTTAMNAIARRGEHRPQAARSPATHMTSTRRALRGAALLATWYGTYIAPPHVHPRRCESDLWTPSGLADRRTQDRSTL